MGEPCDYFISLLVALNACFALSGVNKSVFRINKINRNFNLFNNTSLIFYKSDDQRRSREHRKSRF